MLQAVSTARPSPPAPPVARLRPACVLSAPSPSRLRRAPPAAAGASLSLEGKRFRGTVTAAADSAPRARSRARPLLDEHDHGLVHGAARVGEALDEARQVPAGDGRNEDDALPVDVHRLDRALGRLAPARRPARLRDRAAAVGDGVAGRGACGRRSRPAPRRRRRGRSRRRPRPAPDRSRASRGDASSARRNAAQEGSRARGRARAGRRRAGSARGRSPRPTRRRTSLSPARWARTRIFCLAPVVLKARPCRKVTHDESPFVRPGVRGHGRKRCRRRIQRPARRGENVSSRGPGAPPCASRT